jgi:glycosyltransferase involved in cell wall biosynthesis
MLILFGITAILTLLYFLYPVWLMMLKPSGGDLEETEEIQGVSLILLSFNGQPFLKEKTEFLLKELSSFKNHELIIIDDHSNDGSREFLKGLKGRENINIILKEDHKGIPHTMNLGVKSAKYRHIIFCDQRQDLSENILERLLEPLKHKQTGAVSACISDQDKTHCCSRIRTHENFIKSKESLTGNLIGVYGPLYAIRKECYHPIPDYIILDDLYLSLKILQSRQIRILEDCSITDDGLAALYSYERARRYITGFWQLIREKSLIGPLNSIQLIMLIWHKYLRLLIPVFLLLSYLSLGIMGILNDKYALIFVLLTIAGLISVFPARFAIQKALKNFISLNFYYSIAFFDVLFRQIFSGFPGAIHRNNSN